jgi:hypothetical protein
MDMPDEASAAKPGSSKAHPARAAFAAKPDLASAQAAVRSSLREMAPGLVHVLGFPRLALWFSTDDDADSAAAGGRGAESPQLSVAGLRVVAESVCSQLVQRLGRPKSVPGAGRDGALRVLEMEPAELLNLVVQVGFGPLRGFCELVATRLADLDGQGQLSAQEVGVGERVAAGEAAHSLNARPGRG